MKARRAIALALLHLVANESNVMAVRVACNTSSIEYLIATRIACGLYDGNVQDIVWNSDLIVQPEEPLLGLHALTVDGRSPSVPQTA